MQKIYCYVDESGQDTSAQPGRLSIFVVAVAIFGERRAELERVCLEYEKTSGKARKWNKERPPKRMEYLRLVFNDRRFQKSIYFACLGPFPDKPDYDLETRTGILRAFAHMPLPKDYSVDMYIDGISAAKQAEYKRYLRGSQIRVRRVHRARDESFTLIRLADAIAGLAREAIEGHAKALALLRQAKEAKTAIEV